LLTTRIGFTQAISLLSNIIVFQQVVLYLISEIVINSLLNQCTEEMKRTCHEQINGHISHILSQTALVIKVLMFVLGKSLVTFTNNTQTMK
jgi:hypothetical protein